MTTPAGMRCIPRTLSNGDRVHIYWNAHQIVLQLRHQVPSEENILEPAYKSAVSLLPLDAIAIAKELIDAASTQLSDAQPQKKQARTQPRKQPQKKQATTQAQKKSTDKSKSVEKQSLG